MRIFKIIQKKTLIIFILLALFLPAERLIAQEVTEPPNNCNDIKVNESCGVDIDKDGIDDIEIKNTGVVNGKTKLESKSLKPTQIGGSQYIQSSSIASVIAFYYKYAITLITILTTIMIIMAGVIWLTSAGNAEKITRAKLMISRSFTGLIIALGSYTLLYTINPDLVEFGNLQVLRIEKFAAGIPQDYSMPDSGNVSELTGLVSLDNVPNVTFADKVDKRAMSDVKNNLIKAMDQFKGYKSGNAIITSVTRTPSYQYGLLTRMCGCKPVELLKEELEKKGLKKVEKGQWKPYCAADFPANCQVGYGTLAYEDGIFKSPLVSHMGGKALDMGAAKTGSYQPCGNVAFVDVRSRDSKGVSNAGTDAKGDVCIPKEQQKLIRAMLDNGFCVGLKDGSYLREPWHFEILGGYTSPFCTADYKNDANLKKLYYLQNPTEN